LRFHFPPIGRNFFPRSFCSFFSPHRFLGPPACGYCCLPKHLPRNWRRSFPPPHWPFFFPSFCPRPCVFFIFRDVFSPQKTKALFPSPASRHQSSPIIPAPLFFLSFTTTCSPSTDQASLCAGLLLYANAPDPDS